MNATDFVLFLIDGVSGQVEGRSLLQRRAYFVSVLAGIDSDLGFVTHYNGPYSFFVDNSLTRLKSLGLLNQSGIEPPVRSSRFEIKLYQYRLTNQGVKAVAAAKQTQEYRAVAKACKAVRKAGNPDALILSIAAKTYFTLKKRAHGLSPSDIAREARSYNSTIKKTTLDAAVRFLGELKLGQRSNPN